MDNSEKVKDIVKKKYSQIALQDKITNQTSCCGASDCTTELYNIMNDDYSVLEGYNSDADLGLGCGLPTQFAQIKQGDTVIDLGSGAGNDCFIARNETGPDGKVIGIDFTQEMNEKARVNADKLGFQNVEFYQGDIENIPVADELADVVISNCVLNLVPNKSQVFKEIYRILKPLGHFSISDIVLVGNLPESLIKDAEMYCGCISGAMQKYEYINTIEDVGFNEIKIQKEKTITIPDDILKNYLDQKQLAKFKSGNVGIFSITVFAQKPQICCKNGNC